MDRKRTEENIFIRNATGIVISAVTLLIVLFAVVFYMQEKSSRLAKSWVEHTYEVSFHIQSLFSKLQEASLGERGYLITKNEEYLEPYRDAITDAQKDVPLPRLPVNSSKFDSNAEPANLPVESELSGKKLSINNELEILKWLTSDNSAQQRNFEEMESVVKDLLKYWAGEIELRAGKNALSTQQQDNVLRGKQLMDHVRIMMRFMQSEEARLLEIRTENDTINAKQSAFITYLGIALFYIALIVSIFIYQRSRARSRGELLVYTQELERSEEELKMQQEELKASNEEIEASNEELEEKTRALEEQNVQINRQSAELKESKRSIEEKASELERASKYKSEFLANMSHELRTPLNSLLILAKLLAANEDGNLTPEQMEEASVIYNGGLELLGLINDILDLSKVEAGKLNINVEDVYVENIVKQMQRQFAPVAKESGVEFPVDVAGDIPAELRTDSQRVEQILKNLLSNAFKFTAQGSVALKVHRPDETLSLQRSSLYQDSIAFSVIDSGIGIETSKLKDIFEAFQQEDGSIDRHYGGTGLGLTIARKFAHMLGGEIHVASEKGKGSTFTLVLPVKLVQAEAYSMVDEVYKPMESSKIEIKPMPKTFTAEFIADDRKDIIEKDKVMLIIEDDHNFARTLIKISHRHGYKCLAAGDGKTGLLLVAEERITAIILDLKLPDIDGMNVLEQLKSNLKTRHIPVHIISGRDEISNILPLSKGALGYLQKPAEKEAIDTVFVKIESLLRAEAKHILVVEDDKNSQVAIQSLLRKKDVDIIIASTGTAALESLGNTKFDCVILDLRLPDMTGFEWLEKMEKQLGNAGLPPVVIYTAKELTEEENRQLSHYTGSIIIKGAKSPERLLDEVTLFLHSIESTLSKDQQEIIRMQHNPDKVLHERTVLLVDDDLRNTFALSKLLKKHGMNIIIADNGQMALDKLKLNSTIELVIMDIMMPVMDGYQAMREIRKQRAYSSLPIIALTARAMPQEQEKCMEAGANDYMIKPVDIERLLTLLRVLLFKQEMAA